MLHKNNNKNAQTKGGINVPVVLVGNKSDLDSVRQVSYEAVSQTRLELMSSCPHIVYIETSAKYNQNVGRLFVELLTQARTLDGSGGLGGATGTPELKRGHRKLSRRLSSFGSLPNITLRRKSSGNSTKGKNGGSEKLPNKPKHLLLNGCGDALNGNHLQNGNLSGLNSGSASLTGSLNGVNKFVDNDMMEIKRAIISGVDTISLSDGSKTPPDQKCTIL